MKFTEYITKEGDRWDTIAFSAYGDAANVSGIIESNPTVPITAVLSSGIRLLIPIIEDADVIIDAELLPPWKR